MWIKGLARRRSVAERVGSRRRSQDKRQSVRHRGLRIEQFEERMLLSVAPTTVNDVLINQIGALAPQALTSRAVATDNNGDFVVAWQQYDFNSAGGADSNIYGRYYTNAVQRIDLPAGTQSMALRYNGNAIEELSISAETKPFTAVSDASNDVAGSFQLTYTDPSSNKPYTGTVTGFDEDNNSLTGNAAAISQALGTMASSMTADGITALNGATVQAIDATDYQINFGNASGGNWQPLLTATYDDGSGNSTFTSGFLPAVEVTMVRQPNATVIIPVSSDASVTAANIQYAFSQTSATFDIAPTVFSQTHLAPYGVPATPDDGTAERVGHVAKRDGVRRYVYRWRGVGGSAVDDGLGPDDISSDGQCDGADPQAVERRVSRERPGGARPERAGLAVLQPEQPAGGDGPGRRFRGHLGERGARFGESRQR